MSASAKRKDREFRLTVTTWVEQAFNKACANHLSGLSSKFSLNKPLLAILSLWRKGFIILDRVTKAKVLHRDISFQNMRVNETSTVQFMAIGILNGESHRAYRDCESVYWLCSIALLRKRSSPKVERFV